MFCREAYKLLSLYLDNLLGEAPTRRLEQHTAECVKCRSKLEIMQQIPTALQSDKLMAPSEDFTKLVMQRIVVQQVVTGRGDKGSYASYSRTQVSLVSFQPGQQGQPAQDMDTQSVDEDEEGDAASPAEVILLENRRELAGHVPTAYLLRFTSLAAVFVLSFGLLTYVFQANGTPISTTDTSGRAVMAFANLLTSSFSSPVEVVVGAVVAVGIVITLWVLLVRMQNKVS